ncbi:SGNH/GDSL hydrolase family protein [Nocardioides seonyuensis]|uniref:SGNH/GDSL hydrolase family protein n=1 Tax=Nocardioides seonyuensis TaxID=2518371 RepID=UPI001FC8F091|nr:SGNH/GDSL hydrolase family protein [Nocardioides seonyuensis]
MSDSLRRSAARVLLASAALVGTTAALVAVLGGLLHRQAHAVRGVIGKPLGERAPLAAEVYKRKYGDPVDLLLLGDSIAAGLGAATPDETLGAQLAKRLAKKTRRTVRLRSAAHVGSETSMVRAQLASLPAGYRADVAVVVVGGNDVTHRVRTADSVQHLREVLEPLLAAGTEVVVGTCPDLGALPALPQPLRALASRSSRQLAAAQLDLVTGLGGHAVSLAEVVGPFFITQPDDMFAVDRFHPSGAGYRRTAKAMLPSVLAALGHEHPLPTGHYPPAVGRQDV